MSMRHVIVRLLFKLNDPLIIRVIGRQILRNTMTRETSATSAADATNFSRKTRPFRRLENPKKLCALLVLSNEPRTGRRNSALGSKHTVNL